MKPLYVTSDTHVGVIRGGTTIKTAYDLRGYVLQRLEYLLLSAHDGDLLVNGDLFDTFNISYTDFFKTYELFSDWLGQGNKLYLAAGNHDRSKTTATMSSFDLLGKLLVMSFPDKVVVIYEPHHIIEYGAYVIPHLQNQAQFDLALTKVPKRVEYLFLHANYNNHFAEQSDHSLNLSPEQAQRLLVSRIIMGHEHQRRDEMGGKVLLVGCPYPTSVADCLGNDTKYMLRISDKIEHLPVWETAGNFQRVDWNDLSKVDPAVQFIRVEGSCGEAEAAGMITKLAKLRQTHNAFVITNSVKIAGQDDAAAMRMSLDEIKSFNVLEALLKRLDEKQQIVVKKLMGEIDVSGT